MRKISSLLIFIFIFTGCSLMKNNTNKELTETSKKEILIILSPVDFKDQEYEKLKIIFEDADFKIKIGSIQKGLATGANGTEVDIDLNISEIDENDFEAIVFLGGEGMAKITDDQALQFLAQKFFSAGKTTAAISDAVEILEKAGLLKNLESDFADENVIVDGLFVLAEDSSLAKEFAEKIVKKLKNEI